MNWQERADGMEMLGFIDEADAYEVDQAGVFYDPAIKRFVLMTATGCSCWDGDFDEEQFETLDALESALINGNRNCNPTLMGAEQLMAEARESWAITEVAVGKRLKGERLLDSVGLDLARKFKLFSLTVYDDQDSSTVVTQVTNVAPAAGRALAAKLTAEGAKIKHEVRWVLDGKVQVFAPAAPEYQVERDKKILSANNAEPIESSSRGVYVPGRGWTKVG